MRLRAERADVPRSILDRPLRHENPAYDRSAPDTLEPFRPDFLFRAHPMDALVDARADFEDAFSCTAAVIEQNDEVRLACELSGHPLTRVGVAAHRLHDLHRSVGGAYPLDHRGEN